MARCWVIVWTVDSHTQSSSKKSAATERERERRTRKSMYNNISAFLADESPWNEEEVEVDEGTREREKKRSKEEKKKGEEDEIRRKLSTRASRSSC